MPPSPAFVAAHLAACSALWASGFLFIKLTGGTIPAFALAACRALIAAGVIALVFVLMGRDVRPRGAEWRHWTVLGALNGWGPNVLTAYALVQIPAGLAAIIQASGPLMVAAMAHALFPEERLTGRRIAGVCLGFLGIAALIGPAAWAPAGTVPLGGALAMLATAFSYALGSLYVRGIPSAEPARLALGQQIFSAGPALVLALGVGGPATFATVPESAGPLLALGVLATALPIFLYMRLVRAAGPTRASMTGYLLPVWASLLAFLVLGERVGLREIGAGLVVLTGVALVSWPARR